MTTSSTVSDFDVDAAFADIIAKEWPTLEGRQTPEALCFTPGVLGLGAKAAELARRAGKVRAMPWQSWSLDHIMAKAPDDTWIHPECCLIVPRQNGKSLILVMRVLYGLFKLGEKIIFSAQQWETAKALWKRTWAIVKTTPSLRKLVESHTCSQGRGTIVLESGAEVVFTTRSANAGRGLDVVDLVIYDEAYDLTEADMAALSPTKMAAKDPQTIYTSSAVNQDHHPNGNVLAAVRLRGHAAEEGLFFGEWYAPDHLDRAETPTWRYPNPSFGVIQTDKKLAAEFRAMKTPAGRKNFDVEYLGRGDWPQPEDVHVAVLDAERWGKMTNLQPRLLGDIGIGVDRAPGANGRWAICAAQGTADGTTHLEVGLFRAASLDEVVHCVLALVEHWDPVAVAIDARSPAAVLIPRLEAGGVEPEKATTPTMAAWSGGFLEDALAGRFSHTGQSALADAIEAVVQRTLPQGDFVWARTDDGSTIPVNAATLANGALITYGARTTERALPSRATTTTSSPRRSDDSVDLLTAAF